MARRVDQLVMSTPAGAMQFVEALHIPLPPSPAHLPPLRRPPLPTRPSARPFATIGSGGPTLGDQLKLLRPYFSTVLRSGLASGAGQDAPAAAPLDMQGDAVTRVQGGVDQAFVVGSQIVSFNKDVTEARRSAALNSCLLAQLHASVAHPSPSTADEAFEWHAAYINVLMNIGWVLQTGVSSHQSTANAGTEVSRALLDLISALIPDGAAVALATKVLDAIGQLDASDPFITLYSSRVVEQDLIEFGASMGAQDSAGFLLQVVECAVQVRASQHQALFFKWDASGAEVDGRRYDLSLADDVYKGSPHRLLKTAR